MPPDKKIRVVKRSERERPAQPETIEISSELLARSRMQTLREMQTVVSGWVQEHRQRADEFRANYSSLLKRAGFNSERTTARG